MKLIIIMLFILSTCANVDAQQRNKKKKKRSAKTHVVKKAIVQQPLTASDKAHLSNGFFKVTVIDKRGLDGCRFLLKLEDHSTLEPIGLDEKFLVAGKKIWVKFAVAKNAMSVCMSGTPVNISAAESVE
ncbi:MAG: hypothetical protein H7331_12145 [Bacteroidia bacterium]|nr:hypothetical protein [Bacteroidia bacterium]